MNTPQEQPSSRARQARDEVSIISVLEAVRGRIETILAATGKQWREGRGGEQVMKITCFNPEHIDREPSLEILVSSNRWRCFACDIAGKRVSSTVDLVQAVARIECALGIADHQGQQHYPEAASFVLGLDGPPPAVVTRPPRDEAESVCHRVVSDVIAAEAELRAVHGHPPKGIQQWLASRGLPPVDLYGRVIHFGGHHGYVRLRQKFTDDELTVAGFCLEGRDLFKDCGALIVFRSPAGQSVGVQGIRLPNLMQVGATLTAKAQAEADQMGPNPLEVSANDTAEDLANKRDLARKREQQAGKRPAKNCLSMAGRALYWPFGSDRASAGPVAGGGNGVLMICEGVPDALAAEASGEAEVALGFAGASMVSMLTRDDLRMLVCGDSPTPLWSTIVIALDTDRAGQSQVDELVIRLREAGVDVFDRSDQLAAAADGITLLPGDMAGKVRVFRRTTFGKDVNDSVRL